MLDKIEKHGKYGFINYKEELVVTCKYSWVDIFRDGLCRVELDGKYGIINDKEEVSLLKYDWVGRFQGGLSKVRLDGKYGFINKKGQEVIFSEKEIKDFNKVDLEDLKEYCTLSKGNLFKKFYEEIKSEIGIERLGEINKTNKECVSDIDIKIGYLLD